MVRSATAIKQKDQFIYDTVSKYGKHFRPVVLPSDIERGEVGKCFDWCALQATRLYPKYQYVEGYATDPYTGRPIYHAWLTDGVEAFDPTWQAEYGGKEVPVPSIYTGVVLDIRQVVKFMRSTGYQAVLANHWRAPEIVEEMLKERA